MLLKCAGVLVLAAAAGGWMLRPQADADPQVAAAAAAEARQVAQLRAAAARVCAEGCEAVALAGPAVPVVAEAPGAAAATVAATSPTSPPALPQDLDVWSLHPEGVPAAEVPAAPARWHNLPVPPDETDPTPADESDPYAPPDDATGQG